MENDVELSAVRILCLLYYCGTQKHQMSIDFDETLDYTHQIESESKLQKLDFWLRYPDHLAAALLRGCEDTSLKAYTQEIKNTIRDIFHNEEPDLRVVEMMRYFYGAYEPLDDVMRFLIARSLAFRRFDLRNRRNQYFLTESGCLVVNRLIHDIPEMLWYKERCNLVQKYFGHLNGFDLRKRQYLEEAYRFTPQTAPIPRVDNEVRSRFSRYFQEDL